jgi:hypothetical protein
MLGTFDSPSGCTSTWEVQANGGEEEHGSCARARGWCPEASSRGEAKQPRRCAGRRAGAHRRGEGPPARKLPRSAGRECRALMAAIRGIVLDTSLDAGSKSSL